MRDDQLPHRTGCIIADRLLVLDQRASRYFAVPHDAGAATAIPEPGNHQSAILSWSHDRAPRRDNARITWVSRPRVMVLNNEAASTAMAIFRLWRAERTAVRRLRGGIGAGLALLADVARGEADPQNQQALVSASWRARRLWSAEDRCLPRSIALAGLLRAAGSSAKLMLGVMGQPFAAHAWVQDGDVVINDTLDHAALFTPILIA